MTLRIYEDWEQARRTVLRRRDVMALDEVPEAVRAGIRRVFGEELPPQEAVARILADVRQRGDEALRDWTARIDGLTLDEIEVPVDALGAAYDSLPPDLANRLSRPPTHLLLDDDRNGGDIGPTGDTAGAGGRLRARRHRPAALIPADDRDPGARGWCG